MPEDAPEFQLPNGTMCVYLEELKQKSYNAKMIAVKMKFVSTKKFAFKNGLPA
jgi:hypothetical protein